MKSGVIGVIDGTFENLPSFVESINQGDETFTRSIQVRQEITSDQNQRILRGRAATQKTVETESVNIDEETGDIRVVEKPIKESKYTEFLVVPGEFIVVPSSAGTFAFEMISQELTGVSIDRLSLDLNKYADDYYATSSPWKVGFYGNIGLAEKGVVYGEEVFDDEEIGEILDRSEINQLGLIYDNISEGMKVSMTESGYVEVYTPSNFDESEFADYINFDILEYQKE